MDDLLATGGTLTAACELVQRCGANPVVALLVVELSFLNGRAKLAGYKDLVVSSIYAV